MEEQIKTIALIIVSIILFAPLPSIASDDYTSFAKSLQAKDYDQSLPSQPIEQWLKSILPADITAEFMENITDCGEQTGNPIIDKERDMPLCAQVELKQKNNSVGYLMLFVATEKKGKLKEGAALYFGNFKQDNKTVWIKHLSELTNIK